MDDLSITLPGGPLGTVTGILLIILGILALLFPGLVFTLLVVFFAVFAAIVSIELIRSGLSVPEETVQTRTLQILAGVIGILLGIAILVAPYFFTVAAKSLFGIWAVLTGAGNLLSIFASSSVSERCINILSGFVLAAAGILIIFAPAIITDLFLVIIIGFFAIITGIFSIWFARAPPAGEPEIDNRIYK